MSGIVGVLRTDGAPVDPAVIGRLTESLSFRGPDATQVWTKGQVAFGHTLLRTTDEAENEHQPFTLDGEVWIVADARVDARRELIRELEGTEELLRSPDVELILRAYLRWGESCVEHLLGDFAFGVWDGRSRRLFCGRDHMGVKPFYYAQVGPWFIFSNTLDCVRLHPEVSDKLNDLAISDFILFGCNQESDTTSFDDIRRLKPAHTLGCAGAGVSVQRYWTLPIEEPVYYRDDREYVERFRGLLREAVSDRLRTKRVGVMMSGGLDSPGLAATAVDLLKAPGSVKAFTFVFDQLIPDSERHYATLVARHLDIPIQFFVVDKRTDWAPVGARVTPEPFSDLSDPEPRFQCYRAMADHSRVAFFGEGPDNALTYEWQPHLTWLARHKQWGRLVCDVVGQLRHHKYLPLASRARGVFQRGAKRRYREMTFPSWLDQGLIERLALRDRWLEFKSGPPAAHPVRPFAYASLVVSLWQTLFEELEPAYTTAALEVRHPYVDVRLLRFLLWVPTLPWCRDKRLIRCALREVMPEPVLRRPKTPLQKHPDYERAGLHGPPPGLPSVRAAAYGDLSHVPHRRPESIASFYATLRFVAMSRWLGNIDSNYVEYEGDDSHELTINNRKS